MQLNSGGRPDRPSPGISQALAFFGRPIGVLAHPVLPGERFAEESSSDGHPYSIDIAYGLETDKVVVRTIRQLPATQRIQPIHNLLGALASFAANAQMTRENRFGPEFINEHLARAGQVDAVDTEISVAGRMLPARVLRVDSYQAIDVKYEQEIIVCLARAGAIDEISLDILSPASTFG